MNTMRYYKGLAPRIKDKLLLTRRPNTLTELRTQAHVLDLGHWERREEDHIKGKSAIVPFFKPSVISFSSTSNTKFSSSQPKPPSRASTPSISKKPDLSKILGPDRKPLPEERERRNNNDRCMTYDIRL